MQLGEGCTHCPVRHGAWLEDATVWRTEDQGGLHQREQSYKMTNCPGLPGTKEVLSTDKCSLKTGKVLSKWRKLISLGSSYPAVERGWLQSYDLKATNKKDTPRTWADSGAGAITEKQEGGIQA